MTLPPVTFPVVVPGRRLVVGAERDRIVDEAGVKEMATFLGTDHVMLPTVPHEVRCRWLFCFPTALDGFVFSRPLNGWPLVPFRFELDSLRFSFPNGVAGGSRAVMPLGVYSRSSRLVRPILY